MYLKRDEELALKGYGAYWDSTGGKTFQGAPMAVWERLPIGVRDAWVAAARAIAAAAVSGTSSK